MIENDPGHDDPTAVGRHTIRVDERVDALTRDTNRARRGALLAGAMAALALILLGVVAGVLSTQHDKLASLQSRQTAADVQRALTDTAQRAAICTVITGLRGTYLEAARDSWPRGASDYDHLFLLLSNADATLRCGTR